MAVDWTNAFTCFSRCLLRDKEVDCREKETEIRDLKGKLVKLSSFVRQLEAQKADLIHQVKLQVSTVGSFFVIWWSIFSKFCLYLFFLFYILERISSALFLAYGFSYRVQHWSNTQQQILEFLIRTMDASMNCESRYIKFPSHNDYFIYSHKFSVSILNCQYVNRWK